MTIILLGQTLLHSTSRIRCRTISSRFINCPDV